MTKPKMRMTRQRFVLISILFFHSMNTYMDRACIATAADKIMEDLHISERGQAWRDVLDGFYDLDGTVPCQPDGGLKCFGHPIGASGLRMLYEMYLQLHGRAGKRQLENPRYGLTHNLGGFPFQNICSIAIIGKYN